MGITHYQPHSIQRHCESTSNTAQDTYVLHCAILLSPQHTPDHTPVYLQPRCIPFYQTGTSLLLLVTCCSCPACDRLPQLIAAATRVAATHPWAAGCTARSSSTAAAATSGPPARHLAGLAAAAGHWAVPAAAAGAAAQATAAPLWHPDSGTQLHLARTRGKVQRALCLPHVLSSRTVSGSNRQRGSASIGAGDCQVLNTVCMTRRRPLSTLGIEQQAVEMLLFTPTCN